MVRDQAAAVGQDACAELLLGGGEERIPDHPGVDRAFLERRTRIGRRQEHGLDRRVRHAGLLERLDQQVVDVRALVERDLLALQVGHRLERRILRHEDRLALRRRRLVGDVDEVGAGRLREDRRRLADRAEVDRADVERLEQLRAGRELGPLHLDALRREALLEIAARLQRRERAVLLVADAQRLGLGLGERGRRGAPGRHGEGGQENEATGRREQANGSSHGNSIRGRRVRWNRRARPGVRDRCAVRRRADASCRRRRPGPAATGRSRLRR